MPDLIERVRAVRVNTWDQKPEDIKKMLMKNEGYTDTWDSCFFPTLYAWEETIASRNVFFVIRQGLREGELDLNTVRSLTRKLIGMYIPFLQWANLPEAEALFQEVCEGIMEIESTDDLISLMEEMILYTGRLNYWIEPLMPWDEIIETFNGATE